MLLVDQNTSEDLEISIFVHCKLRRQRAETAGTKLSKGFKRFEDLEVADIFSAYPKNCHSMIFNGEVDKWNWVDLGGICWTNVLD